MRTKYPNNQVGFTLIEMLLYLAIAGGMLLLASTLLIASIDARVKSQTVAEIEQEGLAIMQIITQTVRNAEAITSPTAANSAASSTIDVVTGAKDPTIFDLSSGALRIKEGAGAALALTTSRVTASSLTFTNVTPTSSPGVLKIQFTLTHVNNSGRNELDYSKTFYTTASLRQP